MRQTERSFNIRYKGTGTLHIVATLLTGLTDSYRVIMILCWEVSYMVISSFILYRSRPKIELTLGRVFIRSLLSRVSTLFQPPFGLIILTALSTRPQGNDKHLLYLGSFSLNDEQDACHLEWYKSKRRWLFLDCPEGIGMDSDPLNLSL
jgi:hypothetical protein